MGDGASTSIRHPLQAHWRLKLALTTLLPVALCVFYFALQRIVVRPVRTFEPTWLDRAIAFEPRWVIAYQSLYLLMPVMPWLATSRTQLRRYVTGFALLSIVGLVCFVLFPVSGPRPESHAGYPPYDLLIAYDRPLNCFPSLHAALAAYSVMFGWALLRDSGTRIWARATYGCVGLAWVLVICYSTIATRQHFAIDLPAGILLAAAAHGVAWRTRVGTVTETHGTGGTDDSATLAARGPL